MTVAATTILGVTCTLADTATAATYGPYICTIATSSGTPVPVFPVGARAIPIDVPSTNPIVCTARTPGLAAHTAAGYLAGTQVKSGTMSWEYLRAAYAGAILLVWNAAGGKVV